MKSDFEPYSTREVIQLHLDMPSMIAEVEAEI